MDTRQPERHPVIVAAALMVALALVASAAGPGSNGAVGPTKPPDPEPAKEIDRRIEPHEPEEKGALDRAAGYLEPIFGPIHDTSFVPIPEIILDPNEGDTWGVMAVWLLLDAEDEVRYMIAPDVRYNDTTGVFPVFRILAYPSEDRFWNLLLGKSSTRDEDYELEYEDYGLLGGRAFLESKVLYERDSTERFYGFGNDSDEDAESNYTSAVFYAEAMPGYYVLPSVNVAWKTRLEWFEVQRGQVSGVPYVLREHPIVHRRGAGPAWYWTNRLQLSYDTRDSRDITQEGAYANGYLDVADRSLGSDTSFVRFGVEGRYFHPFRAAKKNPVLASRVRFDWMSASRKSTPFWQMNSLGGRRYLRGFGSDRFIDFNRSLASVELRTRVWSVRLFGVLAELELAPFLETGQVFEDLDDSPVDDLHWVYGFGFRGIVRPQIVAFVDLGLGDEGLSVFTGIDYPF
jgi:hypothetical protein